MAKGNANVDYKKLWKLLIDKDMKKTDLITVAGISSNVLAKLTKEEYVSMESLSYNQFWIFLGNLNNPATESAKQCGRAYKRFVQNYPDYDVNVMLCAYGTKEYQDAKNELGI